MMYWSRFWPNLAFKKLELGRLSSDASLKSTMLLSLPAEMIQAISHEVSIPQFFKSDIHRHRGSVIGHRSIHPSCPFLLLVKIFNWMRQPNWFRDYNFCSWSRSKMSNHSVSHVNKRTRRSPLRCCPASPWILLRGLLGRNCLNFSIWRPQHKDRHHVQQFRELGRFISGPSLLTGIWKA